MFDRRRFVAIPLGRTGQQPWAVLHWIVFFAFGLLGFYDPKTFTTHLDLPEWSGRSRG